MVTLSIITPTYNRRKTIERLYESLKNQSCKDFEWIVIDDGSTDSTSNYFESICLKSEFKIVYEKKANGGKHRALNIGVEYANSKIIMCVDSDDWLPRDSVEKIIFIYNERVVGDISLIGLIAKRGCICNGQIKDLTKVITNVDKMTLYDFYFKYKCSGDTALIYLTSILKKNKFCVFDGEKFISENTLYFQLDVEGKMLLLDEIVYLNEYQPDGLTANYKKLLVSNPNGTAFMYYVYAKSTYSRVKKLKYLGLANYYYRLASLKKNNCQLATYVQKSVRGAIPSVLGFLVERYEKVKGLM